MRAIVCGAGIAGLTASWWLGRQGWGVLLIERVEMRFATTITETRPIAEPGRHAGLYPIRDGQVAAFFVHREESPNLSAPSACPVFAAGKESLVHPRHAALA
jgi:hypothetical protein